MQFVGERIPNRYISSQKCERSSYPIQIFSPKLGQNHHFLYISSFFAVGGGGDGDDDSNRDGDDHHCYSGDNDWELLLSIRNVSYGLEDGDRTALVTTMAIGIVTMI
jgi:hypothetical protein